jgi:putative lipoic acid-binding regulatory protein
LSKVNNLLPLEEFSDILQHLLQNGLQIIYQKTLKVFIKKLSSTSQFNISNQCWLNFFSSLLSIIEQCTKEQNNEQTLVTGQYAFVGLKVIAKHLEHKQELHNELIKTIEITLKVVKDLDVEQPKVFNLFVSGVLCLGKLACVIKNQAIPYISSIIQSILKAFSRNTDIVNLSCFAVIAKLTKIFPTYLGAFLPDILIKLCSLVKRREKLVDLNVKLSIVEKNIITLIPFRKLIEILITTYKQIDANNDECLTYFLKFSEQSFRSLKLATIDENIASINKFIFKLIDQINYIFF